MNEQSIETLELIIRNWKFFAIVSFVVNVIVLISFFALCNNVKKIREIMESKFVPDTRTERQKFYWET